MATQQKQAQFRKTCVGNYRLESLVNLSSFNINYLGFNKRVRPITVGDIITQEELNECTGGAVKVIVHAERQ